MTTPILAPNQAQWLASQLRHGIEYMPLGGNPPKFFFFLAEAEWASWLPRLPAPAGIPDQP